MYRLTVTNAPMFRLQPETQTVSAGQSVLLKSFAVGVKPLRYQWQKDGASILNATNYVLAMDNCSTSDAAGYSVVASSATGVSTSSVARLNVVTNEAPAVLRALSSGGSNIFRFELAGDEGRNYRIEYSTDLVSWGWSLGHGVIFNTNLTTDFQIAKDAPAKFVRVSPYHATSEQCVNNLRQLKTAAWLFAEDQHKDDAAANTLADMAPYLIHPWTMRCPNGWTDYTADNYTTVTVVTTPCCQIVPWSHFFEDP